MVVLAPLMRVENGLSLVKHHEEQVLSIDAHELADARDWRRHGGSHVVRLSDLFSGLDADADEEALIGAKPEELVVIVELSDCDFLVVVLLSASLPH